MNARSKTGLSLFGVLAVSILLGLPVCSAPAQVLINEVVTDPQQDWNDSAGGDMIAFDDFPGTGSVTDSDEWVELLNVSGTTVDLTSWTLEMIDTTSATEVLGRGQAVLVFDSSSSLTQFVPFGRLVIGDPAGSMNNNCLLVLKDSGGSVVDQVELGTADFAGDGVLNNAPSGDAHDLWDEAVAREPDGRMTGDPSLDFRRARATIGHPNPRPPRPPVVLINEVVTDPQRDWNDSAGGNGVAFDPVPGDGAVTDSDEWIELVNVSAYSGSLLYWKLVMCDTTPATETLGVGGATLLFERGGSLDDLQPGEHLVVGNPAGSMNNNIWIRLFDVEGNLVDEVELGNQDFKGNGAGDEAPAGDAAGPGDEAVARLPEAKDTGNDAADFVKQRATIGFANSSTAAWRWELYP